MSNIAQALEILVELDFPKGQRNERSALCLLALLDLKAKDQWSSAREPLIGITPIMNFARDNYARDYKPNTRETFRRQTMHQFVDAGIALINPDDPKRPTNSPKTVYQIQPEVLVLLRNYGTENWNELLSHYQSKQSSLAEQYAKERDMLQVPVNSKEGEVVYLSPGKHSELIGKVIHEFAPRFTPDADLIYAGDTGKKFSYFDEAALELIGVKIEGHGKMPDVILHFKAKEWLVLVEVVTSHGPMDSKRHKELEDLFRTSKLGLVYVTAFESRSFMARYLSEISWETEVWVAESPSHLIHFNGERFLGPYENHK